MIIDQQSQVSISDPISQTPDWAFGTPGSQGPGPGPVNREVIYLTGTTTTGGSLGAIIDDVEGPEH